MAGHCTLAQCPTDLHRALVVPVRDHGRLRGDQGRVELPSPEGRARVVRQQDGEVITSPEAPPTKQYCDNQAAIASAYNPENHGKLKHVERRHIFIREAIEEAKICVPFVRSDENLADFFTKPLRPQRFFELRDKIMNVKEPSSPSDGKRISFAET